MLYRRLNVETYPCSIRGLIPRTLDLRLQSCAVDLPLGELGQDVFLDLCSKLSRSLMHLGREDTARGEALSSLGGSHSHRQTPHLLVETKFVPLVTILLFFGHATPHETLPHR